MNEQENIRRFPRISPAAHVDSRARIASGVEIGPFCHVGPDVSIGENTHLVGNVTLTGRVALGAENKVYPGAVIGGEPQDLTYRDEPTEVVIGDQNVIREGVTINRGTVKDDGVTRIGNHCYLMACTHVAHDCWLGDHVVIANGTLLGGHVHIHERASISGGAAVHHYATIGSYAFVSGLSAVRKDVPPYMLIDGSPARPRCVNLVALRRAGFSPETISALSEAHRLLFRLKVGVDSARQTLRLKGLLLPAVNHLLGFIEGQYEGRHGRSRERRRAA